MTGSVYRERTAPPGLGLAVTWRQTIAAEPYVQLVVPDGSIDVIYFEQAGELQVAGPDTGPQPTGLAPGESLVGVRFRPGQAAPALSVPADALRDGRVPLRELWGPEADALAARLAGSANPGGELVSAITARIRAAGPADPAVPALVTELADGRGVKAAAADLGFSERQLRRRSLAAFGYGPKTLQRILRFQRALRLLRAGRPPAEVAYETGYADQAHLSHEVRDLAGVPIRELP